MDLLLSGFALLFGFYMAWNIGANDVANAMGTSVGSKAISLRKAVLLAAIFEFSGAFFLGSHVSETIQTGIIDTQISCLAPHLFVLGMIGSLLATGILLQIASYLALPVSTTHALVGAILGFGLLAGGPEAIFWSRIGTIVMSWIISPLLSGITAYFFFQILKKKVFLARDPRKALTLYLPLLLASSALALLISLFPHGIDHLGLACSFPVSLSISLALSSIVGWACYRVVQALVQPQLALAEPLSPRFPLEKALEKPFILLQILSACLIAFAHGANDVANAIGPVAAALHTIKMKALTASAPVPVWLLGLGGVGIIVGLATWGWRVIETVGKKITKLTPAHGFSAEYSAAITILLASKAGLPISSTHALIGAVLGVGLTQGKHALNFSMLKEMTISWLVTIPLCAVLSAAIFYGLQTILSSSL